MDMRSAIAKINRRGVLLVFPINNRKEPLSLWSEFYPRKKLRWEWDDSGDNRVFDMWTLMKRLSDCDKVVYSKWYQNRATFFSRELFTALLSLKMRQPDFQMLSPTAKLLLEILEQDSPLSTKQLKQQSELQGKFNEGIYNRGMKELFQRLQIVAYGEVDDGAFPSLAVGATRLLFEDLWNEASELSEKIAEQVLERDMPSGSLFRKAFDRSNALRGRVVVDGP
jgi:hypothetical protein